MATPVMQPTLTPEPAELNEFGTEDIAVTENPDPASQDKSIEGVTQDHKNALKAIVEVLENEDDYVRKEQMKVWRRADLYWQGLQDVFYSPLTNDYMTLNDGLALTPDEDINLDDYDRILNIYRATGETIIAALGSDVPKTLFFPSDADNPDDILTSKSFTHISKLIQRHNNGRIAVLKILYFLYKHGTVAVYNYPNEDEEYGVVTEQTIENVPDEMSQSFCPECGEPLESPEEQMCPDCGGMVTPESETVIAEIPTVTQETVIPKSRQLLEIYGPLYFKVPPYAMEQKDCGYLIVETEHHEAQLKSIYPQIASKISAGTTDGTLDREYRSNLPGESMSIQLTTLKRVWLRPWMFNNAEANEADTNVDTELAEMFPNGVTFVMINNEVTDVLPESLDEHWTISANPLSDKIHSDGLGKVVMPLQEMDTDLVNLEMETIAHGIPETHADPEVVDFEKMNDTEARPGSVYPIKQARPGAPLDHSFFQLKPAMYAPEIASFRRDLDQRRQFLSGSFPSIYGGDLIGSRTASEYESSKQQALQRLSIAYMILKQTWTDVMTKAVKGYAAGMLEDESFTARSGESYEKVWIRRAELTGSIGHIEPESVSEFPTSWSERRSMLFSLFEKKIPQLDAFLFHPENVDAMHKLLGLPDFKIPGNAQRDRQLEEIQELLQAPPIPINPEMGQFQSSIQPDPYVDDGPVHIEVLRSWINSDIGSDAERTNPEGFMNVMAHLVEHITLDQQMQMQQAMMGQPPEEAGPSGPPNNDVQPVG